MKYLIRLMENGKEMRKIRKFRVPNKNSENDR